MTDKESGLAPVKAEYRVAVRPAPASAPHAKTESEEGPPVVVNPGGVAVDSDGGGQYVQARKRQRGMNKQRKPHKPEAGDEIKLCAAIIQGKECKFGDGCRFSHDLAAYFAQRPADLDEVCPIYTLRGECRFGVTCRFGACHLESPSGRSLTKVVVDPVPEELNVIPWDFTNSLRKRQYDFSRSDAISEPIQREITEQHERHQSGQRAAPLTTVPSADGLHTTQGLGDAADKSETEKAGAADEDGEGAPASELAVDVATERSSYYERAATSTAIPLHERKLIDFRGKLYLAPLTTVGNLPFRRVCKGFGADITCGEMALATALLQGSASEWALLKRHPSEDIFGAQIAGNQAQAMGRVAQLLDERVSLDFVDINMGCPIDSVCNKGMGSALAQRSGRVQAVVRTMSSVLRCPLTVKMRIGYDNDTPTAHKLIPRLPGWGATAVTLHGRSRQQRYSRSADWSFISRCAALATEAGRAHASSIGRPDLAPFPLIGNGDVYSYEDAVRAMGEGEGGGATAVMVARGALVKPWIFTEIKERRHWDISASERLEILKQFTRYGLEHWGTDDLGIARVRRFLLEWLSFLYRYVPIGLLERLPPRLQDRPPAFIGRNDLETLMASPSAADWVKITEMLLGPVPSGFTFIPKHKANAYGTPIEAEG